MRRKIVAVSFLVIGSILVLYPIVGNIINVLRQKAVQADYNVMVQQINPEKKESLKNEAEEYNRKLAVGEIEIVSTDEDSISDDYDDGSGYSNVLDIGADEIGFIKIPKIDIDLPIYKGTNTATLEKGIGHLRNTSLPVGGESTHCVLTGHTGLPSSMLFTDLPKLETGDYFYIQYLDEIHAYRVDSIKVVEPTDDSDLNITPGKDYVTLLTCFPYGVNSHRLLVRGERVPYNGRLTFNDSGKVETIKGSAVQTGIFSEDTPASDQGEKEGIFDDILTNSPKVSVYGINLSLTFVIAASAIISLFVAIIAVRTVVKAVKSKNGTRSDEDEAK